MMRYQCGTKLGRAFFSTASTSHPIKKVSVVGLGLMGHGVV